MCMKIAQVYDNLGPNKKVGRSADFFHPAVAACR